MKLIYAQGFSKNEKLEWKPVVFTNIVHSFRLIFDAMNELDIKFENEENEVRHSQPNKDGMSPLFALASREAIVLSLTEFVSQKNMAQIMVDYEMTADEPLPDEYLEPVKKLWLDGGVKAAIEKGNEYALHDNLD